MKTADLRLGEELSNHDHARRPIKSSERQPGPVPYLGASGIVDMVEGFTHDGDFLCVSEDGENLRSRSTPIAWVQQGQFWANNHLHVLGGVPLPRLRFYAAALNQANISSYLTGSAQPKLSQKSLNAVVLTRFDAAGQTAIGEVLGALDDKIAANRRVVDVSTRLLSSIVETSPGRCALSALASIQRGSLAPDQMSPIGVRHFSLPAFDRGFAAVEMPSEIKSAKQPISSPVVLVSKLNPRIPRVWPLDVIPAEPAVASTEFVVLAPADRVEVAELWGAVRSDGFMQNLLSHVAGTTGSHQRVRPADLLPIEVSDVRSLSTPARTLVRSLCRKVGLAGDESQRLVATRDELLPLLMDGRITVRDAEKRVEGEV